MRVFSISSFGKDAPRFGESDLERKGDYVRIKYEDSNVVDLAHYAFVWPATELNLKLYAEYVSFRSELEHHIGEGMHRTLNSMARH